METESPDSMCLIDEQSRTDYWIVDFGSFKSNFVVISLRKANKL